MVLRLVSSNLQGPDTAVHHMLVLVCVMELAVTVLRRYSSRWKSTAQARSLDEFMVMPCKRKNRRGEGSKREREYTRHRRRFCHCRTFQWHQGRNQPHTDSNWPWLLNSCHYCFHRLSRSRQRQTLPVSEVPKVPFSLDTGTLKWPAEAGSCQYAVFVRIFFSFYSLFLQSLSLFLLPLYISSTGV